MSINKKANNIINTTIKLFVRDGIKKTTMNDIAKNSGVSKVTIYKYFSDKDTLYFEVSKCIFSNYIDKLENILTSGEVLIKKLYYYLDVICDFTNSGKFELCKKLSKYNNDIEIEYELYLQTYRYSMLNLIDEGIKSGFIKSEPGRDMIFHYINMGIVYYQQAPEYRNKILGDSNFQKQFMMFYISNIFTDEAQILSYL